MTELSGVGAELRQAREAQGLAIVDVAQQLKFAPRQIESLEAERFERLPGPTIARGMVRNYARLLKLDPEPLVERMALRAIATDPEDLAARFKKPEPFSDNGRRSTFVYVGFSAAVLLLVGLLAYEWHRERAAPQFMASAPAKRAPAALAEEPSAPPPEARPATQTAAATQVPAVVSEPPPAAEEKAAPAMPEKQAAAEKAAAGAPTVADKPTLAEQPTSVEQPTAAEKLAAADTPAASDNPPAAGLHRIVLRCEEEAWLEVRDAEGRALISSLNPAGTERAVRGRGPFSLVIGNAHHVKLFYDGKPVDLQPHIRVEVARLTLQ